MLIGEREEVSAEQTAAFMETGTVHILSNAVIEGDVHVAGGQVIIDGTVRGLAKVYAGRLTVNGTVGGRLDAQASERLIIGPNAIIGGTLKYRSTQEAQIDPGARIAGAVSFEPMTEVRVGKDAPRAAFWSIIGAMTAFSTLALLGMVLLIVWLWRRFAGETLQETSDRFWQSLGRGLVYAIITPIVAILLAVSIIGLIPGILLAMAYIALMTLAKVMAGMFLGAWFEAVIKKRPNLHVTWLNAVLGVIAFLIVSMIPLVGFLLSLVIVLALFGVMAQKVQKMLV